MISVRSSFTYRGFGNVNDVKGPKKDVLTEISAVQHFFKVNSPNLRLIVFSTSNKDDFPKPRRVPQTPGVGDCLHNSQLAHHRNRCGQADFPVHENSLTTKGTNDYDDFHISQFSSFVFLLQKILQVLRCEPQNKNFINQLKGNTAIGPHREVFFIQFRIVEKLDVESVSNLDSVNWVCCGQFLLSINMI